MIGNNSATNPKNKYIDNLHLTGGTAGVEREAIAQRANQLVPIGSSAPVPTPQSSLNTPTASSGQNTPQNDYINNIASAPPVPAQSFNLPKADPYQTYLQSMFDPKQLDTSFQNQKSLNEQISKETLRARDQQDIIKKNEIGQLERGLNYDLGEASSKSARTLADLSLAKGANTDILNQLLSAGKSLSEAKQAQDKADKDTQLVAQKFAIDNKISKPFYSVDGKTYIRTSDQKTYPTWEAFIADGGAADSSNVQIITPDNTIDLKQYPASYQEYLLAKQDGFQGGYNDYQTMDANRKAIRSTTNNIINDSSKEFDLRVKQAPAQVASLKSQGLGWQEAVDYLQALNIPINGDVEDALQRNYRTPQEYSTWKLLQK